MNNSVLSHDLEVKYAGDAIEYGTLALLMESLVQQPVLVMPLERSILQGSIAIFQWMIHVTSRTDANSPITYATFRAAEVKQTVLGQTLIYPSQEAWLANPKERVFFLFEIWANFYAWSDGRVGHRAVTNTTIRPGVESAHHTTLE